MQSSVNQSIEGTTIMNTDFTVEVKINGQPIIVDLGKVDETWLNHCLAYGVRRFINDKNAGLKGQTKYDACQLLNQDMTSGEPMPEKVRKTATTADPILALAVKNAKAALTVVFKTVTGETRAVDFAKHDKIAPFFTVSDDRATWVEATVVAWMDKQKADKKADYMKDAKATIEGADKAVADLDF